MFDSISPGSDASPADTGTERWARCEATGRRVPESKLVTLHGRRMSIEAKQRMLERLPRTLVSDSTLDRPSIPRRLTCAALDAAVLAAVAMVGYMVCYAAYFGAVLEKTDPGNMPAPPEAFQDGFQLLFVSGLIGYLIVCHGVFGRTPGKIWGRAKVIRIDGSEMTMETATLRALALVVPLLLIGLANCLEDQNIAGELVLFAMAYQIFDTGMGLFDLEDQRSLHDRIAGTRVVHVPR